MSTILRGGRLFNPIIFNFHDFCKTARRLKVALFRHLHCKKTRSWQVHNSLSSLSWAKRFRWKWDEAWGRSLSLVNVFFWFTFSLSLLKDTLFALFTLLTWFSFLSCLIYFVYLVSFSLFGTRSKTWYTWYTSILPGIQEHSLQDKTSQKNMPRRPFKAGRSRKKLNHLKPKLFNAKSHQNHQRFSPQRLSPLFCWRFFHGLPECLVRSPFWRPNEGKKDFP